MTDPLEAEIVRAQPRVSRLGLDSILEDLFGLNIRALKSIAALFRTPARYFDAARDRDWLGRFTPSFRVWLGLFAVMAAMRFIYGGEDSPMVNNIVVQLEAEPMLGDDDSLTLDVRQFAVDMYKWMFVFLPFIFLPTYAVVAFLFRSFPGDPGFVLRLRYVFATVIPSTTFVVVVTPLLLLPLSAAQIGWLGLGSFAGMVVLDYVTAYRGALSTRKTGRAGVALGYTCLLLVAYMAATMLATLPAGVIAVVANLSRAAGS